MKLKMDGRSVLGLVSVLGSVFGATIGVRAANPGWAQTPDKVVLTSAAVILGIIVLSILFEEE